MNFASIVTMWKREFKGYFYTPLAWVLIGIFSVLMGLMFYFFLLAYQQYTQQTQFGMGQSITIDRLAEAFYGNMHVILMFILPAFTMRLFTEESRQNTMALLMTSPVRTWELTIAKFKAGVSMLFIMLAVTIIFPIFLVLYSAPGANQGPDLGIVATTYLGLFLAGAVYIAIGEFWSSITESAMTAFMLTYASIFGLWLLGMGAQNSSGSVQEVLKYLSIGEHFGAFSKGVLELKSAVYFCSFVFFALFLTNRSLESRSWRA